MHDWMHDGNNDAARRGGGGGRDAARGGGCACGGHSRSGIGFLTEWHAAFPHFPALPRPRSMAQSSLSIAPHPPIFRVYSGTLPSLSGGEMTTCALGIAPLLTHSLGAILIHENCSFSATRSQYNAGKGQNDCVNVRLVRTLVVVQGRGVSGRRMCVGVALRLRF